MTTAKKATSTYRNDLLRAPLAGILEAGWATFALVIAIRYFEASETHKAFIAGAAPYWFSPHADHALSRRQLPRPPELKLHLHLGYGDLVAIRCKHRSITPLFHAFRRLKSGRCRTTRPLNATNLHGELHPRGAGQSHELAIYFDRPLFNWLRPRRRSLT